MIVHFTFNVPGERAKLPRYDRAPIALQMHYHFASNVVHYPSGMVACTCCKMVDYGSTMLPLHSPQNSWHYVIPMVTLGFHYICLKL